MSEGGIMAFMSEVGRGLVRRWLYSLGRAFWIIGPLPCFFPQPGVNAKEQCYDNAFNVHLYDGGKHTPAIQYYCCSRPYPRITPYASIIHS